MKNLKQLFLLVTISVMSFSCGSDDDGGSGSSSDSYFIYGDTEFQLKSGVIENYGDYYVDGVYNFDISLFSSEMSVVDDELVFDDNLVSGLYFELFTEAEGDLETGTYSFESGSYDANTFGDGALYINISQDGSADGESYDITSGSLTVLDNGSTYEFEFSGAASSGETFSGYFRGTLSAFDYSSENRPVVEANTKSKKVKFRK
ncbi:hypothetical protein [Winogradskyella endarachnes]|uniref:Uncharacterized protein n=1 Tax=Winogradskyella endarachnes TaxID=2681965 RepID=A0A6L6UBZ7_9FLAO|nr:hypothetical protein [Winogradskyella endarachnes]MUU78472.1 hypothetical protein [Winogradskyella endarachnes]